MHLNTLKPVPPLTDKLLLRDNSSHLVYIDTLVTIEHTFTRSWSEYVNVDVYLLRCPVKYIYRSYAEDNMSSNRTKITMMCL